MNRSDFRRRVEERVLFLDGAMGTELAKRGMPPGVCPEDWALENAATLAAVHADYARAGVDIVYACSFGANRLKLADHALQKEVLRLNAGVAAVARRAVDAVRSGVAVFGSLSPTGRLVEPTGDLDFDEAVDVYREQAAALLEGGVDGFVVETMIDAQEARAALLGVRAAAPDHPVLVSLTFGPDGRTLGGTPPEAAVVTLQALGADAVGANCAAGPEQFMPWLETMRDHARVPLLAKPNAGLPRAAPGGGVRYDVAPEDFARETARFVELGVRLIGGCCGTTPAHLAAAVRACKAAEAPRFRPLDWSRERAAAVSSARRTHVFSAPGLGGGPLTLIGERINPTGKKALQAELREGRLDAVRRFADEQIETGADLLDVNVGLAGVDETRLLERVGGTLSAAVAAPLVFDTADPDAAERALRRYPGRALVNSISAEPQRLERLLPVAARYGAALVVLPVSSEGVPEDADGRMAVTRRIMAAAREHGYGDDDVLVDGLALAVAGDALAGRRTLEFLARAAAEGPWRTVLGLSNVSFGMPGRPWLNASFLAMAMANGLTAVIANPSADGLVDAVRAADGLLGRDAGMARLIQRFAGRRPAAAAAASTTPTTTVSDAAGKPAEAAASAAEALSTAGELGRAVLRGEVERARRLARAALDEGEKAGDLLNQHLIPAVTRSGALFESGEYFLPQLMLAGEAMQAALAVVEPALAEERALSGAAPAGSRGRVVMATVEGDVHDIGKNIVILMLRNHDFAVVDLGKDVPPAKVAEAAAREKADLVGLSALMTTTLAGMRKTVDALRAAEFSGRILVGGAAVTEGFAEEIGADGYSADAVGAVRLACRLLDERNAD